MASATNIKFPDGKVEVRNILTSFEKNGTNVIVFETDKVDNGHKVVGVSYLSDGMYQNIIDQNKWSEIKNYLVDILHDRMGNEEYRLVPEEVLVTADPYHPLGLRDENLDKMVSSYEAFKTTKEVVTPVVEETLTTPVEQVENVVLTEPAVTEVAPTLTENVSETIMPAEPVITEAPKLEEEAPAITPAVEEPILDPFAIADSLVQTSNNVENTIHEDIVPPVGIDIVNNPVENIAPVAEEVQSVVSEPVIEEIPVKESVVVEQPVQESAIAFPQPEVSLEPVNPVVEKESVVKDAYLNGADNIIQQMRDTTEKYLNEMHAIQERYIKEMEEMRSEISRNLEEARGINELSKQTFDKAQSMSEGSVLELTRTA